MTSIRLGIRSVLFCFLVAGMSASTFGQTWIGTANGNWSVGANWAGGVPSSANTTSLIFNNRGSTAITATNDLGANFLLSKLIFDNDGTADFILASGAGNSIRFDGTSRLIRTSGGFSSTISSNVSSNGSLNIEASPNTFESLTMSGIISDGTSAASLIIDRPDTNWFRLPYAGAVTLSGANTFTGGVTLNRGNLNIDNASALGTGTLTINGGTINRGTSVSPLTIGNNVVVNGGIRSFNGTITYSGFVSGNGGFTGHANSGATFQSFSTLTGNVEIGVTDGNHWTPTRDPFENGGTFTLNGNGRLLGIDQFTIRNGGRLVLNNNVGGNLINRVADSAVINLKNGSFDFTGLATGASSETVGAINGRGFNTITVTPGSSVGADPTLNVASINRDGRGTFFIRGDNLGRTTPAGNGRLNSSSAPTLVGGGGAAGTAQISIVPWATGQHSSISFVANHPDSLLTYNAAVGFRPLDHASEYGSSLLSSTLADNVRITATETVTGVANVNALVVAGTASVGGTGQINLNSGTVLINTVGNIDADLNFGTNEGHIFASNDNVLNGNLIGSNGLTKSGTSTTEFKGDNRGLTGTLTINDGLVAFEDRDNLPGSSQIQVSSRAGQTGLKWVSHSDNVTMTRGLEILDGLARIELAPSNDGLEDILSWSGVISGTGGLHITRELVTRNSIRLANDNTYSGPTKISGGNLRLSSDGAFGNSPTVELSSPISEGLILEANWTTSRQIMMGGGQIDTGAFNATLNGDFVATTGSSLQKIGVGSLTINRNIPVPGVLNIRVNEGSLYLNSVGTNINVSGGSGAAIGIKGVFGGTGRAADVTLGTTGIIRPGVEAGSIDDLEMASLLWNPGARLNFDMASPGINDQLNIYGAFTKGTAGTGSGYSFKFDELGISLGTYTLINFATTDFTAGDFSAIWSNPNITGTFILNSNNLQYQITAIPEPTGLLVLIAGSLIAIQRRRRTGK